VNKAVFLDRDGTINVDKHFVYKPEDFEFISGVPQAIKSLNDDGYKVIVISNQSGIARGFYTIIDVEKLHKYIDGELAKQGAKIDAYYICPHHPDFTGECECRKPKTGLVDRAVREFDVDVSVSYMVGDKESDEECARGAGLRFERNILKGNKYIFYGAGYYARENLDRLISEGFVPACFVDSDINKHNKKFGNTEYIILSLEEAIAKYPDCEFLVTVSIRFCTEVHKLLVDRGINSQKIKFAENVELRNGCTLFEETMVVSGDRIKICCISSFYDSCFDMNSDDSLLEAIKKYEENMELLHKKWLNFEENPCSECTYLKQGFYPTTIKTISIIFQTGFKNDICNFNCIYCGPYHQLKLKNPSNIDLYEIIIQLSHHFDYQGIIFNFGNGEFLACKEREKILKFLYDKGAKINLVSNSSIYSETLANLICDGRVVGINTSLDAGTSETFAKVKNVSIEMYNKVVNNILKYSQLTSIPLYDLKYIMLEGINDNENDINGFVNVCKQIGPRICYISANVSVANVRLSKNTMDMIVLLNNKLMQNGFDVAFAEGEFNPEDIKIIQKIVNKEGY